MAENSETIDIKDMSGGSEGEPSKAAEKPTDAENGSFFDTCVRPCVAEFLGLILFVFISTMSVQDRLSPDVTLPSAVAVAVAHGLTIALLVAGFGNVSGAHLNPAVTLGIALSGGIKIPLAIAYVIVQLLGSLVGAGLVRAVLPLAKYEEIGAGAHTLGADVQPGPAILCEVMLTLILVLVVLMCAVDTDKNVLAPLAIGFAVTVDILAGIYVTGASMNPARSFGPAVVVSNVMPDVWKHHYVYWVGPGIGAVVAALFYRLCLASPQKRLIMKGTPQSDYQQF